MIRFTCMPPPLSIITDEQINKQQFLQSRSNLLPSKYVVSACGKIENNINDLIVLLDERIADLINESNPTLIYISEEENFHETTSPLNTFVCDQIILHHKNIPIIEGEWGNNRNELDNKLFSKCVNNNCNNMGKLVTFKSNNVEITVVKVRRKFPSISHRSPNTIQKATRKTSVSCTRLRYKSIKKRNTYLLNERYQETIPFSTFDVVGNDENMSPVSDMLESQKVSKPLNNTEWHLSSVSTSIFKETQSQLQNRKSSYLENEIISFENDAIDNHKENGYSYMESRHTNSENDINSFDSLYNYQKKHKFRFWLNKLDTN